MRWCRPGTVARAVAVCAPEGPPHRHDVQALLFGAPVPTSMPYSLRKESLRERFWWPAA